MLIIARKLHESILIGDDVEVFVEKINGTCVRIGIKASCDVPIFRSELIHPETKICVSGTSKGKFTIQGIKDERQYK